MSFVLVQIVRYLVTVFQTANGSDVIASVDKSIVKIVTIAIAFTASNAIGDGCCTKSQLLVANL